MGNYSEKLGENARLRMSLANNVISAGVLISSLY